MSILEHEQSKTSSMPYALRPMLPEDTQAVAEIEREAFPTTWPPTPLRKELHNRLARYLVSYRPSDEVGAEAVAQPFSHECRRKPHAEHRDIDDIDMPR